MVVFFLTDFQHLSLTGRTKIGISFIVTVVVSFLVVASGVSYPKHVSTHMI